MNYIIIIKASHDMQDCVYFSDVCQELIAKALAL